MSVMCRLVLKPNANAPLSSSLLTFVNVDVFTFYGDDSNPCLIFSENSGSVITGFATDFQLFKGNLSFVNNRAIIGATFQLFSFSHLFLMPPLSAVFEGNHDLRCSIIRAVDESYDNKMCVFQ